MFYINACEKKMADKESAKTTETTVSPFFFQNFAGQRCDDQCDEQKGCKEKSVWREILKNG